MTALHPIVAFARDALGFVLHPRQADILSEIYADAIRTPVLRTGRRSGKGRVAAIVGVYEATVNAATHLAAVPAGEQVAVIVVARTQKQARIVHRYIRGFLERPAFAEFHPFERVTQDEIELSNGIVIITVPCHAASARGAAAAVVILDEAAWYFGTDGSPLNPKEIWDALVPATAQFPQGKVLVLSTPRLSTGWFAELVAKAASGLLANMRTWHATTAQMNPSISPAFLEEQRQLDPVAFRREYEAEFEAGLGAALDDELVRAAIRDGAEALPPRIEVPSYAIAMDPAYTGDTFALLVGHREPGGRVVVDRVRGWQGSRGQPVQVEATLDEVTALSQAYNDAPVITDQYSAAIIKQRLRVRGVTVIEKPWTNELKVNALAAVRRVLYAGQLEIPRHRELVAQLSALEQRATPAGRPRIAAPPGGHDDYAVTLMALVHHLDRTGMRRVLGRDPTTGRTTLTYQPAPEPVAAGGIA